MRSHGHCCVAFSKTLAEVLNSSDVSSAFLLPFIYAVDVVENQYQLGPDPKQAPCTKLNCSNLRSHEQLVMCTPLLFLEGCNRVSNMSIDRTILHTLVGAYLRCRTVVCLQLHCTRLGRLPGPARTTVLHVPAVSSQQEAHLFALPTRSSRKPFARMRKRYRGATSLLRSNVEGSCSDLHARPTCFCHGQGADTCFTSKPLRELLPFYTSTCSL